MLAANNGFRLLYGGVVLAGLCRAQVADRVDAKLEASINAQGVLEASVVVVANGVWASPYREAFRKDTTAVASRSLFGTFIQNRQLASSPVVTDADRPERPIQVRIPILEDYFVLPIERLHAIRIDLVPFAALGASKPEENQRVGQFREEIHLAIPPGFALSSNAHTTTETEFARYQSNVESENGQLQITRELQFKQAPTPALNRTELESFWKVVREDQQSAFQLRRIQRTDSSAWMKSVRPEQANSFGTLAYQQREYEAARQLFERAIEAHRDGLDRGGDHRRDQSGPLALENAVSVASTLLLAEATQEERQKKADRIPAPEYAES